jgi:hypothetical protein
MEDKMASIYGIEESNAQGFIENNFVCLPHSADDKLDLHNTVSPISNEDIVFIKHCISKSGLQIKAIGVVKSEFPLDVDSEYCLPVEWLWLGEIFLKNFDENFLLRESPYYEEHDILVQRAVIDLLPEKYKLTQEW